MVDTNFTDLQTAFTNLATGVTALLNDLKTDLTEQAALLAKAQQGGTPVDFQPMIDAANSMLASVQNFDSQVQAATAAAKPVTGQ